MLRVWSWKYWASNLGLEALWQQWAVIIQPRSNVFSKTYLQGFNSWTMTISVAWCFSDQILSSQGNDCTVAKYWRSITRETQTKKLWLCGWWLEYQFNVLKILNCFENILKSVVNGRFQANWRSWPWVYKPATNNKILFKTCIAVCLSVLNLLDRKVCRKSKSTAALD